MENFSGLTFCQLISSASIPNLFDGYSKHKAARSIAFSVANIGFWYVNAKQMISKTKCESLFSSGL